jgi:ferredoxin
MSSYRITIDRNLCSGFGTCEELAPQLFRLGSDGIASAVVAETDDQGALDAAAGCPMAAIGVSEIPSERRAA